MKATTDSTSSLRDTAEPVSAGSMKQQQASIDTPERRSSMQTLLTSPQLSSRVLQYSEHGGVRRATSPTTANAQESYLHSKMKYHRALASLASPTPTGAASGQDACTGDAFDTPESSTILNLLHPPAHVLPASFFIRLPFGLGQDEVHGTQGSWGFIFTVVNTMMGSTLMCLPWGFQIAGLVTGTLVTVGFGVVSFYTSALILQWGTANPSHTFEDFGDLCQTYLGPRTKQMANVTAIAIVVGAAASYHVLMATNLQAVVLSLSGRDSLAFLCCGAGNFEYVTAAVAVVVGVMPLLFVRDIGKLAKIGSYGVLSLLYNVCFIVGTAVLNVIDVASLGKDKRPGKLAPAGELNQVGVFIGMMGLSLFVHSVLLPIAGSHSKLRTQPAAVKRDLGVAYTLAVVFYVVVGLVPAAAFELGRDLLPAYRGQQMLPQNVLLSYPQSSIGACVGRAMLVLQIAIVYPILVAVIRKQFYQGCWNIENPSNAQVTLFNLITAGFTTLVCCVYPNPGNVTCYVGTYTAVVYMLWLPLLVHLNASKRAGKSSKLSVSGNVLLGIIGTAVILGQFVV